MTTKFDELVAKLKEIFQIDKPKLDFGIYKIVDAKHKVETKMKMMVFAACAMVAAFAAVADDAPPPPRFLGFALGDKVECERKAKKLAAKHKAELAARESAAGTMAFEVSYGEKCVEAVLASLTTERFARRAYSISARR